MRAICVDDEPLAVEYTLGQCERLPQISEAKGFTDALAALEWLGTHSAELAILDINMPKMDGIELAARIKQRSPQTAILFLTAYREYAFDAIITRPGERGTPSEGCGWGLGDASRREPRAEPEGGPRDSAGNRERVPGRAQEGARIPD